MKSTVILLTIALGVVLIVLTNQTMAQGAPSVPLALRSSGEGAAVAQASPQKVIPPQYCKPCLFYGGDWNFTSSDYVIFANGDSLGFGPPAENIQMYSAFRVLKGKIWTVTGLFSNVVFTNTNSMDPSTPQWSINSGMKAGSAGKVIASGRNRGTAKPTGRGVEQCGLGFCPEYTVLVKLPKPVKLKSGTYYESVEPLCTNTNDDSCTNALFYLSDSYDMTETKQGAFAYGPKEPKGQNFQNGPHLGYNYVKIDEAYCTSLGYSAVACDWMSDGVIGTEK